MSSNYKTRFKDCWKGVKEWLVFAVAMAPMVNVLIAVNIVRSDHGVPASKFLLLIILGLPQHKEGSNRIKRNDSTGRSALWEQRVVFWAKIILWEINWSLKSL